MSNDIIKPERDKSLSLHGMTSEEAIQRAFGAKPAAKPTGVIKRIVGHPFQYGGDEHTGWLPKGAAKPLPTPIKNVRLDIEIEGDGDGYLLCFSAEDGSLSNDYWFQSLQEAEGAAQEMFGVTPSQWQLA